MTIVEPLVECRTLADRLSEGTITVPEALSYATLLGEALRKLHDSGNAHGNLTAESIVLTGGELHLAPAPESLDSDAANVSADIFAFGALLYQMMTGRKILSEEAAAFPESTGIPKADRLIASCLAKEAPARLLNMQKVLLELKLVTATSRLAEVPAALRRDPVGVALRDEMQRLEARMAVRIEEIERSITEKQQAATDALVSQMALRLEEHEKAMAEKQQAAVEALMNTLRTRFQATEVRLAAAQQSIESTAARLTALEQSIDSLSKHNDAIEAKLVTEIPRLEEGIEAQATIIAAVRTSTAQLDDLVERVVEAMETVQETILDMANARP